MEEEHGRGLFDGSSFRESFASDALAGLTPSLLDDEPLGASLAAHHADDVFADVSAALELGEHDQSLFPMLNDTSLDFIDVEETQQMVNAGAATAVESPFETQDLSPILAPVAMPAAMEADDHSSDLHLAAPSTPVVLRRHSGGVDRIVLRSSPGTRQALMQLVDAHVNRSNAVGTPTRRSPRKKAAAMSAMASPLRRRQRPAAAPVPLSWTDNEQNSFFSLFKAKWPPTVGGQAQKAFGTLLLQRFDQISTKVKSKSVVEVRQFYNAVLQNVAALLRNVDHDIDLTNPDEIRIAVWCWSKLLVTEADAVQQFQTTGVMDESVKGRVAHTLHQSIVRSRRQMLKAKSTELVYGPSHRAALTSISTWMNRSSANAFAAVAPSNSAGNQQDGETGSACKAVIHHPVVRRKNSTTPIRTASSPVTSAMNGEASLPAQALLEQFGTPKPKVKRSFGDVTPDVSIGGHSTPMVKKQKRQNKLSGPDFMSPPQAALSGRAAAATHREIAFQTPQELSRKKMYIKMRMVPKDPQTKAQVTENGCRHKVELKLSSSKRMSEVVKHMEAKWSKVRGSVGSNMILHFFQKGYDFVNGSAGGWTETDDDVTCLDIWKQCGRQVNGENVVEVSYGWLSPSPSSAPIPRRKKSSTKKTSKLARSSGDLFGSKPVASKEGPAGRADDSPLSAAPTPDFARQMLLQNGDDLLSPGRGLQAFGEHLSFERDSSDHEAAEVLSLGGGDLSDAYSDPSSPLSGRPRRRIMPVLVAHEGINSVSL